MRSGKGKKVIAVLQRAVVNHEAENYSLFTDPDCHTLKDYRMRGIQTGFRPCCCRGEDGGRYFATTTDRTGIPDCAFMSFDVKRTAASVTSS